MAPHLSLDERRIIAALLQRKICVAQIAAQIGRHRSTVHRVAAPAVEWSMDRSRLRI